MGSFRQAVNDARDLLLMEQGNPRDLLVSAWREVEIGWRYVARPHPAQLKAEHDALNQILHQTESLGADIGGEHRGIYHNSVDALPEDEFSALRQRMLKFVQSGIEWEESTRS